jgi:hypothetical protein
MKLTNRQREQIRTALRANDMTMARFCRTAGFQIRHFYNWFYGGTGEKHNRCSEYLAAIKRILNYDID